MRWKHFSLPAALAATLALSGCAGGYLLDNSVQTFSQLSSVPAQPGYRFDRLPSQQAADPMQTTLEQVAEPALYKAGLRRDDTAPRYSVQVTARQEEVLSPFADPWSYRGWGGWGWGAGYYGRGVGVGIGSSMYPSRFEQLWYRREVSVVMRDLGTQQVVYETRAMNDGPWSDARVVFPLMFEAAMQGFPNPPQGPRRVDIHVGG